MEILTVDDHNLDVMIETGSLWLVNDMGGGVTDASILISYVLWLKNHKYSTQIISDLRSSGPKQKVVLLWWNQEHLLYHQLLYLHRGWYQHQHPINVARPSAKSWFVCNRILAGNINQMIRESMIGFFISFYRFWMVLGIGKLTAVALVEEVA